ARRTPRKEAAMAGTEELPPERMRELYPFLYTDHPAHRTAHPGNGDSDSADAETVPTEPGSPGAVMLLDSVLSEVSRSTAEKAAEIVGLRSEIAGRLTGRLVACAEAMADRFAAGGRLFSFGNGGSSTDADEVAGAFSYPAGGRPLPALCLTSDVA